MVLGVVKETRNGEVRVPVTPSMVSRLSAYCKVVVETNAGVASGFTDSAYVSAGAVVVDSAAEVWEVANVMVKVQAPTPDEFAMTRKGQTVFAFYQFAVNEDVCHDVVASGVNAVAWECVTDVRGNRPVAASMGRIAGELAVVEAAKFLQHQVGGCGKLMTPQPNQFATRVVVVGAGNAGLAAAKRAVSMGCQVVVMEVSHQRAQQVQDVLPGVEVLVYSRQTFESAIVGADVLVTAVHVDEGQAPVFVHDAHLRSMTTGAVVVDVNADVGGCVEGGRATTHAQPVVKMHGVNYYGVPNMPAAVPHTSSVVLATAIEPIVEQVASLGVVDAVRQNVHLANAVIAWKGVVTHPVVARTVSATFVPVKDAVNHNDAVRNSVVR